MALDCTNTAGLETTESHLPDRTPKRRTRVFNHGTLFGIGSIIAASLVARER